MEAGEIRRRDHMTKKTPAPKTQLTHNPFAHLAKERAALPEGPDRAAEAAATAAAGEGPSQKSPARAVVRLSRKGRGGKDATLVEKLGLEGDALERWCRELKAALGCGGVVEGENLVLQGDQRERLTALLEARGVCRVTMG